MLDDEHKNGSGPIGIEVKAPPRIEKRGNILAG